MRRSRSVRERRTGGEDEAKEEVKAEIGFAAHLLAPAGSGLAAAAAAFRGSVSLQASDGGGDSTAALSSTQASMPSYLGTSQRDDGSDDGCDPDSIRGSGHSSDLRADALLGSAKQASLLSFRKPRSAQRTVSKTSPPTTINTLQFRKLPLYGRAKETAAVAAAAKRTADEGQTKRELLLISGRSGTGKSALARQLEDPIERAGGFYCYGKFDQNQRGEPYGGIASACHELCLAVHNLKDKEGAASRRSDGIVARIKEELGQDVRVLTAVLPLLKELLGVDYSSDDGKADGVGTMEARNRFSYAFRRFFRVISSFGPVALVLDDLQWSDAASLELLEVMISDLKNPRLMVVALYRSNEVDDNPLLAEMIRDVNCRSKEDGINVAALELGNLAVDVTHQMINDLLSSDLEKTHGLAAIVHRKTDGNPFFIIQFLLSLTMYELLTFDFASMEWQWDEETVEDRMNATANVVDLMQENLSKIDSEVTSKLPVFALLGSTFETWMVSSVLDSFETGAQDAAETTTRLEDQNKALTASKFLEICVKEGLIEPVGRYGSQGSYRWVHDKIQQAVLTLITEEQQKDWRLKVGRILLRKLSSAEIKEHLFLIVSLLTNVADVVLEDGTFRLETANYFLRAGEKAQRSSAFRQAAYYLQKGIELLPVDHWKTHYQLSLQLYSSAAQAEYCIGDADRMINHCNEVLAQTDQPLEDKFPCYLISLEAPARLDDLAGAIASSLSILDSLGCTFPRSALQAPAALAQLLRWKRKLKRSISADHILHLKVMDDRKRIFCMHLLDKMDKFCFISGNLNLFILVVLRRLAWTIEYGYCEHSPSAFSSIGILYTGALGDIALGKTCAQHCLSLQERVGSRAIESENFLRCYGLNLHFTTPLLVVMKALLYGYQIGLEMGELTSAMFCVYHYLELCRASGKPLEVLDTDYVVYTKQMKEANQWQAHGWAAVEHQGVLNLMGQSQETTVLKGTAMDQDEVLASIEQSKNLTLRCAVRRKQMYLACFFCEHELGANLALKYGEDALKQLAGSNGTISQCFLSALSCLSAYRQTNMSKYKAFAKRMTGRIQSWIKKGNPNIIHFGALLDAEWAALKRGGKKVLAKEHFDYANKISARLGYIQDRALINERYSEFWLGLGDKREAQFRLEEAKKFYQEWGAEGKLSQLITKYENSF